MSDGPVLPPAAAELAAAILAGRAVLSPAAAELSAAILAAGPPESFEAAPGAMARFAVGLCAEDERRRTTAALTRSPELRRTLLRLRAEYAAWSRDPQGTRPEGWRETLEGAMAALREPGRIVKKRVLRAIAAEAAEGFALARDAGGGPRLDPRLESLADLAYEGEAAIVRERTPGALEGAGLRLDLLDPGGGALTLATGSIEGGVWRVDVPLDLAPGWLRVALAEGVDDGEDEGDDARALFASVAGSPETVRIGLVERPRFENGRLRVALAISDALRAAYPGYGLRLSLPLGDLELRLGTWPLTAGGNATLFAAEIPGVSDGPLPYGSVIGLELGPIP